MGAIEAVCKLLDLAPPAAEQTSHTDPFWCDCCWRTGPSGGCDGNLWGDVSEKAADEFADAERHAGVAIKHLRHWTDKPAVRHRRSGAAGDLLSLSSRPQRLDRRPAHSPDPQGI